MSDRNLTHDQEMVVESHAPYLKVFVALAAFTALEYAYARVFKDAFTPLVVGLMSLALVKAGLVGWYFMHLKFEGRWVYALLVPVGLLACVVVAGLVPDIAFRPMSEEAEPTSATATPAPGRLGTP